MSSAWGLSWTSHGSNGTVVRMRLADGRRYDISCLREGRGRVLSPRGGHIDRSRYNSSADDHSARLTKMLQRYFQYAVIVGHTGDGFHDYIPVVVDGNRFVPYRNLTFCAYWIGFNCYQIKGDDFLRLQLGEPINIPVGDEPLGELLERNADKAQEDSERRWRR